MIGIEETEMRFSFAGDRNGKTSTITVGRAFLSWEKRECEEGNVPLERVWIPRYSRNGAGTRNRTGDTSLEGWGFTPKLCPLGFSCSGNLKQLEDGTVFMQTLEPITQSCSTVSSFRDW